MASHLPNAVEQLVEVQQAAVLGQDVDKTYGDYLRRIALAGSWADVCAVLFLKWYAVWKKRQSQNMDWLEFRRQVLEATSPLAATT